MREGGDGAVSIAVIERLATICEVNAGQRLIGLERRRCVGRCGCRRCPVCCRGCSGRSSVSYFCYFRGLKPLNIFFGETLQLVGVVFLAEAEEAADGFERERYDFNETISAFLFALNIVRIRVFINHRQFGASHDRAVNRIARFGYHHDEGCDTKHNCKTFEHWITPLFTERETATQHVRNIQQRWTKNHDEHGRKQKCSQRKQKFEGSLLCGLLGALPSLGSKAV